MPLHKQTVERLEQVIRVLEELPKDKKFSLQEWMICGTVGCAIGWAASDTWFKRRGLKLEARVRGERRPRYYIPTFKTFYQWYAVEKFFRLNKAQARYLFHPAPNYRTRRQVIARIRKFIKDNS